MIPTPRCSAEKRKRDAIAQFRDDYRALLRALHRAFNGEPDYLGAAMGLMYTLDVTGRQLMATPIGGPDSPTAGSSF